jgi:hypothetical protein
VRIRSEQSISVLAVVALVFLASCTRNVKETQFTTENAKFNLILIMDTCIGCEDFNWSMKSFLDRLEDNNNVVLLMTTGYSHHEYSYGGVDAITAASRIANEEEIVTRLSEEIDRIIGDAR